MGVKGVVGNVIVTQPRSGVDPGHGQTVLSPREPVDRPGVRVHGDHREPLPPHSDQSLIVSDTPVLTRGVGECDTGIPEESLLCLWQDVVICFMF